MANRRTSAATEPAPAPTTEDVNSGAVAKIDPRDAVLQQYREFTPKFKGSRVPEHDAHLRVGNVPAERCVTWATDPRIDNGRCISIYQGLGFRLVEIDEVSSDPNLPEYLFVRHFEEGPNRTVAMGGGVLMIGYRQYQEQRKEFERQESRAQVAKNEDKLDALGIRRSSSTQRGSLQEV